jgi:L-asparaginase/Glu-tRNA(Gln) amidotransferase subunit D
MNRYFSLENRERLKQVPIVFFKLGGTWDMVFRDGQKIGSGNFDDDKLLEIQKELGYFTKVPSERAAVELKLVTKLYSMFTQTKADKDVGKHLSSWAKNEKTDENLSDFIKGPFLPLFSGDSSHLTNYIIAPMIKILTEKAVKERKPILGAQGTDTADIAILQLFDVLTFDTALPPLIMTGANRSHNESDSDAPGNFVDLAKLAHVDLSSGAHWVFQKNLYKAADFYKIDPMEHRIIERQSTFLSPHEKQRFIGDILEHSVITNRRSKKPPLSAEHIINKFTPEELYRALEAVYTDDLGNINSIPRSMGEYYDPTNKAIIIAAHSLGNSNNVTRFDAVNAAKAGKLVVSASRTLIGNVSKEYAASLLSANQSPEELGGTGNIIISAGKLNKTVCNALVVRAILENLNQQQTQKLFNDYAYSCGLE